MSYASTILGDSPLRYWRLGDPSGTTMVDETGNQDGTYHNTPTLGEPSLLPSGEGNSARFTAASSEYADVIDSVSTRLTTYTIECWVKQATWGQQTIIEAYPNGASQRTNNVFFGGVGGTAPTGTISGAVAGNNDVGVLVDVSDTPPALETHYVVFTLEYSGGTTTAQLYIDCALVVTDTASISSPDVNATEWLIGKDAGFGGTWHQDYLDAWVQELAIYDYVLTDLHVDRHCEAAQPQATYVGRWL